MPFHAPHLNDKLNILFQHNKTINTKAQLANCLNIKPHNIPVWCNGTEVKRADQIPDRHVAKLTELFGIDTDILKVESLNEFEKLLISQQKPSVDVWNILIQQAEINELLTLVREGPLKKSYLFPPDEADTPLEQFHVNEGVAIRLDMDDEWKNRAKDNKAHLIMFHKDPEGIKNLCPSNKVHVHQLTLDHQTFIIPYKRPNSDQLFLKVSGPVGEQSTYALLTTHALPFADQLIQQEFGAVLPSEMLGKIAHQTTSMNRSHWRLLKYSYEVVY